MLSIENILLILRKSKYVNSLDMVTMASYLNIGKQGITTKKFRFFESEYLTRNLKKILKCEWLEFLIIFQEFKEIIKSNKGDMKKAINFCDKMNLSFDSMINFVEFRYDIILDIHSTTGILFAEESPAESLFSLAVKIKDGSAVGLDSAVISGFVSELKEKVEYMKKIFYACYKINTAVCVDTNLFKCLSNGLQVKHYTFAASPGDLVLFDSSIIRRGLTGSYEPSFVNGITNITNCNIPIEPVIHVLQ